MASTRLNLFVRATFVGSLISFNNPVPLLAEPQWRQINAEAKEVTNEVFWKAVPIENSSEEKAVWQPLTLEADELGPKQTAWMDLNTNSGSPAEETTKKTTKSNEVNTEMEPLKTQEIRRGLRWPNGQLMSEEDNTYYRTAYSRGSMIQIGETLYPNLGFNALQRHPKSWLSTAIVAIDDSRIGRANCETGNFFQDCADGLLEARFRLWNSEALSFDLHWTMHSLSGEGAPFNFIVGDQSVGSSDAGTKFGDGQSIGFVASKNFGKTLGLSFAGYRLFHFDKVTDLPKNFALYGTKIFRLNESLEPPIISFSLGIMSDVYNPETNLGSITYPESLLGGAYTSIFAQQFSKTENGYTSDVAGVSSAFVCADTTIFATYSGKKFKPSNQADPNCIKQVYVGPIASIGFAPWPWLGIYAKYSGTDVDLGISLKPFKDFPWTLSIEALNPIKGVNPILDASYDFKECRGKDHFSFSDCRTRIGIYTELSF